MEQRGWMALSSNLVDCSSVSMLTFLSSMTLEAPYRIVAQLGRAAAPGRLVMRERIEDSDALSAEWSHLALDHPWSKLAAQTLWEGETVGYLSAEELRAALEQRAGERVLLPKETRGRFIAWYPEYSSLEEDLLQLDVQVLACHASVLEHPALEALVQDFQTFLQSRSSLEHEGSRYTEGGLPELEIWTALSERLRENALGDEALLRAPPGSLMRNRNSP